jgi:hypothetical protein
MRTNFGDNSFLDSLQYEEFVRKTYEALISHRMGKVYSKKLYTGQRTGHQHEIDVSIELEIADLSILILVECKHYRNKVDISDLLEFAQRIDDIGAHKGVMVTTIGYREGALKVARAHRIALVTTVPKWERPLVKSAGRPSVDESKNKEARRIPVTVRIVDYEEESFWDHINNISKVSLKHAIHELHYPVDFSSAWNGIISSLRNKVIRDFLKKGILKIQLECPRCRKILRDFRYGKCTNCLTVLESSKFTDMDQYECDCRKMIVRPNLNSRAAKCECGKTINHVTLRIMYRKRINDLIKKSSSKMRK